MHSQQISWGWVIVALIVAGLLFHQSIMVAVALLAGGLYLAQRNRIQGRGRSLRGKRTKEVYWRGRRIDL